MNITPSAASQALTRLRNVLNDDTLIAQNGLSAASTPVVFQYPEPRVFLLTSGFDF